MAESVKRDDRYCDWCYWRLGVKRRAKWAARGNEIDLYCDKHKGQAREGVDPIEDDE